MTKKEWQEYQKINEVAEMENITYEDAVRLVLQLPYYVEWVKEMKELKREVKNGR